MSWTKTAQNCVYLTHFLEGTFLRLPYRLTLGPEIFQKQNFEIFGYINGCEIYFDDLIIAESSIEVYDNIEVYFK